MPVLTKAQIKHIQSFVHKKYRDEHFSFIIEGKKSVLDSIRLGLQLDTLYTTESMGITGEIVIEDFELNKISQLTTPQICVGIFKKNQIKQCELNGKHSLLLHEIQDPGNMGTIIRTAHWFGIENIIISGNCADPFSPKAVQASMASIAAVKIIHENAIDVLAKNISIPSFATILHGEKLHEVGALQESIIVMGNEGKGLPQEIIEACSRKITIQGIGEAESLNVAIATSIICHKFCIG
jgi:RNA methyltransferase, TrmH family